jgi:hypothetical protein
MGVSLKRKVVHVPLVSRKPCLRRAAPCDRYLRDWFVISVWKFVHNVIAQCRVVPIRKHWERWTVRRLGALIIYEMTSY